MARDPNERVTVVNPATGDVNDTITYEGYELALKPLGWKLATSEDIAKAEKAAAKRES